MRTCNILPLRHLAAVMSALAVSLVLGAGGAGAATEASTADHSKFKELKGPFSTGPEVTRACLQCHTEASKQLHKTKHWTWDVVNPETGQRLGKKNINIQQTVPQQGEDNQGPGGHVNEPLRPE